MVYPKHDFDMAIQDYADHLVATYNKTGSDGQYQVSFDRGRKFLKVVDSLWNDNSQSWGSRSVHSFVCIKEHDGWKYGDILKAASWAQPAKNFARGNVLNTESYKAIRWTGV